MSVPTAIPEPTPAWVVDDAMRADDVQRAAEGVQVIVHAVNPPGYRNWGGLVLPMTDNSIAAAKAAGARCGPRRSDSASSWACWW